MTQRELERAVSRATGEDVRAVRRRGFSIADLASPAYDPGPDDSPPRTVDWDEVDRQRRVQVIG